MENISSSERVAAPLRRFIWDLTYACPLRCLHCYSESGRRPARMLGRADSLKIVDVIINAGPERVSFSGGEPLLAPWWGEAARLLRAKKIPVTLFTSGWLMDGRAAQELADSVAHVSVSVDGASDRVHDMIRGRAGSFHKTMETLEQLDRTKRERTERGADCYTLAVDCTVTRSAKDGTERLVHDVTSRFTAVDFVRFGAVIPEGLAQERAFTERELLTEEEVAALGESQAQLASKARNGAQVSVTDIRAFIPGLRADGEDDTPVHIEPDGQLRALTNFEAKVGNVLHEPFDVLWDRVLAWRNDPYVVKQMSSIRTIEDWAKVTRILDRAYGSDADKARIVRRGAKI